MKNLDLLKEVAALGGYVIVGPSQQTVDNKERAQRRVNTVRSDVASRYAGRWASAYKEGWLPLVPVYGVGTVTLTQNSRIITGVGTVWTADMVGRKFLGPDSAYYKIIAFSSTTSLTLSEPYQGSTTSGGSYQIWKDEYVLYPDAFSIIDFINYVDPAQMVEDTNKHARLVNPRNTANETPKRWTLVGRKRYVEYSVGTVSGSLNSRTLTGVGTAWLGNVYPGYELIIGNYKYHVESVDSDTQVTLAEYITVVIPVLTTYTGAGRNALIVRFLSPSCQTIVNYAYYTKVYPLVNDFDEDWIAELYAHVIIAGVMKYDFIDKNDPTRASQAAQMFENDMHNAHQADNAQFGGVSVVGLDIPDSARL